MSITKQDVVNFFDNIGAEIKADLSLAEAEIAKDVALAGNFLRSTAATLAKDPVLLQAIQNGFKDAVAAVKSTVEGKGTIALVEACVTEAKNLLVSVGQTADHELVPIVTNELQAAVTPDVVAVPTVVNP